ncbi:Hypothetical Protein RradSPS_1345 [Rubrobacter radiotolerans]|uniref:Uncharacterized protein n=1 Tax=Rubrobacter radiotolerans TaxID=42256 RepID=A0A023X2T0_RUBRA|nr:hypothetical protein [Rubrobacter radiotolerans]AHY46628.1 Hypothetical Protein RradSPS_1345 [Rubrobacter radiotolerans]MDX5894035.1 hypothetical protein [Rubrobacter radiotolerans]SMC05026.1 DNA primase large subunit [Rubrobacter radiotolerans DSM 5868]
MSVEDLKQSPTMKNILDGLESGEDVGHYGRLVFAMVGRYFVENEELAQLLSKDRDCSEEEARALVSQVEEKDYNPPRRERLVEWQREQDFKFLDENDPDAGNLYSELQFPDSVFEDIEQYREEKAN